MRKFSRLKLLKFVPWLKSGGDEILKADRHVLRLILEHMVCVFLKIFNLLLHLQYVTRAQAYAPYQWHTQVLISLMRHSNTNENTLFQIFPKKR